MNILVKNFSRNFICHPFVLLIFISSCAKLPVSNTHYSEFKRIEVGPGPEDFVLDTLTNSDPRFLVSCSERRKKDTVFGEIYVVDISTGKSFILPRKNNPQNLVFRPHGIDLVKNISGDIWLYCVSHNDKMKEHSVIIYKVFSDHLDFQQKLDNPLLVSPNDVAATPTGEFFVTNDAGKRNSNMEHLFGLAHANVVMYVENNFMKNPNTGDWEKKPVWQVAAHKLNYANGVAVGKFSQIYVSTVMGNELNSYKLNIKGNGFEKKKVIVKLKGLDNISFLNKNEILVTSHPSLIKFLKHVKNARNKSPSVVYKVNLESGKVETVFSDDGGKISASSTAVLFNGKLYISQVFDGFILECK